MQRFKNILVLYQGRIGDEETLDHAITLARDNGAALTLATALKLPVGPARAILSPSSPDVRRHYACLIDERLRHLQRLAAGIRPGNFPIHCKALAGRPNEEVIRVIRRDRIDLTMMTADYETVLGAIAFGSLSIQLMRNAPCPVWVFRPGRDGEAGSVLATVDPAGPDVAPSPLDIHILNVAAALARRRNGHLDILHAWELKGADLQTSRSEITDEITERLLCRGSSACARALAQLCTAVDLDGLETEIHLPRGAAPAEIARFASCRPVDIIVMGVARTGFAASLFGNTAEDVLQRVSASVLTVKQSILAHTMESVGDTRSRQAPPICRTHSVIRSRSTNS
ncbi:MAG: universal stress protein [Kiloniellales bacterium]